MGPFYRTYLSQDAEIPRVSASHRKPNSSRSLQESSPGGRFSTTLLVPIWATRETRDGLVENQR